MSYQLPIAILLLILGFLTLGRAMWCTLRGFQSIWWPEATGTVLTSSTDEISDDGVFYENNISYSYAINGGEFVNSSIKVCGDTVHSFSWFSKRIIRKYPAGTKVTVHYNPKKHTESVLEPGVNYYVVLGLGVVSVILIRNSWSLLSASL